MEPPFAGWADFVDGTPPIKRKLTIKTPDSGLLVENFYSVGELIHLEKDDQSPWTLTPVVPGAIFSSDYIIKPYKNYYVDFYMPNYDVMAE